MKAKRKRMLILAMVVVFIVAVGAVFGVPKANASRGNYYERGEDGRIYYYGEGNDPSIQLIITPMPGRENEFLEGTGSK